MAATREDVIRLKDPNFMRVWEDKLRKVFHDTQRIVAVQNRVQRIIDTVEREWNDWNRLKATSVLKEIYGAEMMENFLKYNNIRGRSHIARDVDNRDVIEYLVHRYAERGWLKNNDLRLGFFEKDGSKKASVAGAGGLEITDEEAAEIVANAEAGAAVEPETTTTHAVVTEVRHGRVNVLPTAHNRQVRSPQQNCAKRKQNERSDDEEEPEIDGKIAGKKGDSDEEYEKSESEDDEDEDVVEEMVDGNGSSDEDDGDEEVEVSRGRFFDQWDENAETPGRVDEAGNATDSGYFTKLTKPRPGTVLPWSFSEVEQNTIPYGNQNDRRKSVQYNGELKIREYSKLDRILKPEDLVKIDLSRYRKPYNGNEQPKLHNVSLELYELPSKWYVGFIFV
jgi:hypothetical protein